MIKNIIIPVGPGGGRSGGNVFLSQTKYFIVNPLYRKVSKAALIAEGWNAVTARDSAVRITERGRKRGNKIHSFFQYALGAFGQHIVPHIEFGFGPSTIRYGFQQPVSRGEYLPELPQHGQILTVYAGQNSVEETPS